MKDQHDFQRLHYRVEEEISWTELGGVGLAGVIMILMIVQALWAPLALMTFMGVSVFLTFLFTIIYQRCLERVRALVRAVAFVEDEEREKLLALEDEA